MSIAVRVEMPGNLPPQLTEKIVEVRRDHDLL